MRGLDLGQEIRYIVYKNEQNELKTTSNILNIVKKNEEIYGENKAVYATIQNCRMVSRTYDKYSEYNIVPIINI